MLDPRDAPHRTPRKPPRWLFRYVMNPLMRRLLRTPFGARRIGRVLMLLTFSGRKSGRPYTTPVSYQRVSSDTLRSFTHSPWWRNLEGGVPVEVLIEGRAWRATAEATRDPEELFRNVKAFLQLEGPRNARRIGLSLRGDSMPSDEELRAALQVQGLVQVTVRLAAPR